MDLTRKHNAKNFSYEIVKNFAEHIALRYDNRPLGIIFYGSQRGGLEKDGLIDFYVIFDSLKDFPQKRWAFYGNKILPPNIYFLKYKDRRAKVAFMTLRQLHKRTCFESLDTTIWARFSQPISLAWTRNNRAAFLLREEICRSIRTAFIWSILLGPEKGAVHSYLSALFCHTFKAEIRVENKSRIDLLVKNNLLRYSSFFPVLAKKSGFPFLEEDGVFHFYIENNRRSFFKRRWKLLCVIGKVQNILRLLKAGATFNGGADYIRWKIRRHRGINIQPTLYAKKHPSLELFITVLKTGAAIFRNGNI